MELIEGETLAQRLSRGAIPTPELLRLGAQIAEALACAHRAGIVHRDLKPANVMLGRSGAKLMDFGLARNELPGAGGWGAAIDSAPTQTRTAASPAPPVTPLTASGTIVGTLQYLAPEQLEGREADASSDLWALGCVLYEMATGRRAFDGGSPASVLSSILRDEPRAMSELVPLAPAGLERIVRACLEKRPEQRWQSAHDVALALAWAGGETALVAESAAPGEERFVLTATHVRQLADRNPRLVGYPVTYVDNHADSDTLVVYLHGVGADSGRFERVTRSARHRAIAVDLVGFGTASSYRPVLGMDDHSRVLRILLRDRVASLRPRRTLLVGHSAGADQFLRMVHDPEGAGVDVAGIVALSPNVSLETCFASRLYARIDPSDPGGTLAMLKSLASDVDSLEAWLVVQNYLTQTFMKLGTDFGPLRRYAADLVEPFERPGDPLADWYRSARAKIPFVRLVFAHEEQPAIEKLIARHLEHNVLGDDFREESLAIEPVHHLGLLDPDLIARHVADAIGASGG